jgi:hypothetical protein
MLAIMLILVAATAKHSSTCKGVEIHQRQQSSSTLQTNAIVVGRRRAFQPHLNRERRRVTCEDQNAGTFAPRVSGMA